jgi:hypothetical protein
VKPIKADWDALKWRTKNQTRKRGRARQATAPVPTKAGQISWACNHKRCDHCTKLDCPHDCHRYTSVNS